MKTNIKLIATAVTLAGSLNAWSAMGGLNVRSHLGERFSGSITVSGDEARALMEGGRVSVSGGIRGSVSKNGNGTVTVHLRSSRPIHEPVLSFTVSAGSQTREYTAMLDPAHYTPTRPAETKRPAQTRQEKAKAKAEAEAAKSAAKAQKAQEKKSSAKTAEQNTKVEIVQDFIKRDTVTNKADTAPKQTATSPGKTAPTIKNDKPAASQAVEKKPVSQAQPAAATPKKPTKAAVTPRRHRAQAGERLSDIAERYRPRNMSLQTAMRALVLANPRAFRHGTSVRRNVTLYIPTESQWHVYAQRAQTAAPATMQATQTPRRAVQNSVHAAPSSGKVAQPSSNVPAAGTTGGDVADAPAPKPASEAPVSHETKPESGGSIPASSVSNTANAAETASSAPTTANNTPDTAASDAAASQASMENAASVASEAASAVSQAVLPPEETQSPVAVSEPAETVEGESEDGNWLVLGAAAAGGAAVLGGGAYAIYSLIRRRRQDGSIEETEEEIDDDDVLWDEEPTPSSSLKKQALAATQYSEDLTEKSAGADGHETEAAQGDFTLDTFEPEGIRSGNYSESFDAEPEQEDDWAWLEGGNKPEPTSDADAFEGEEWLLDEGPDDISLTVSAATSDKAEASSSSNEEFVIEDDLSEFQIESDLDDFVLSDDAQTSSVSNDLDLSGLDGLGDLDFSLPKSEAAAPKKPSAAAEDDLDLSGLDGLGDLDFSLPKSEAAAPKKPSAVAEDDLDLSGLDGLDDLDFGLPEAEAAAPKKPSAAAEDDLDLSRLDGLDDLDFGLPKSEAVAPKKPSAVAEDDLDLSGLDGLDDLDFGLPEAEAAAPKKPSAAAEDDLDLSGLDGLDDLDFGLPEAEAAVPKKPNDLDLSGLDGLGDLDFGLPKSEAAAPKKQSAAAEDDLDLSGLDGLGDLDFGLPDSEVAAPKKSPAQAVIDDLGLDGLGDLDFGLSKTKVASSQESLAAMPDMVSTKSPAQAVIDDLGLDGLEDLDFDLPKPEVVMPKQSSAVADNDFNLSNLDELESLDFHSSVSEQVQAAHSDSDGLGALDFDPFKPEDSKHHADAMELADAESLGLPESNGLELKEVSSISSGLSEADDTALMMPELQDGGLSWEQHPVVGDDKDSGLVFSSMEEVNQAETLDNHLAVSDTFDTLDMPTESLSMADDAWLGDLDEGMAFADLPEPESGGESVSLGELADLESFDASDWDDDMLASDGSVGFVSGAVGMEEPQEAKLDLARMYLDIEDEAAARDTLTELVAEASGEVLEEAKRLLADLG